VAKWLLHGDSRPLGVHQDIYPAKGYSATLRLRRPADASTVSLIWAGLRPSTPSNVPYIGRSTPANLGLNGGPGHAGLDHGAGSGQALAELISGRRPALAFAFCGES